MGTVETCGLVRQLKDLKRAESEEGRRQAQDGAAALGDGLAAVQGVPGHAGVGCHHAPCTRSGDALHQTR